MSMTNTSSMTSLVCSSKSSPSCLSICSSVTKPCFWASVLTSTRMAFSSCASAPLGPAFVARAGAAFAAGSFPAFAGSGLAGATFASVGLRGRRLGAGGRGRARRRLPLRGFATARAGTTFAGSASPPSCPARGSSSPWSPSFPSPSSPLLSPRPGRQIAQRLRRLLHARQIASRVSAAPDPSPTRSARAPARVARPRAPGA